MEVLTLIRHDYQKHIFQENQTLSISLREHFNNPIANFLTKSRI